MPSGCLSQLGALTLLRFPGNEPDTTAQRKGGPAICAQLKQHKGRSDGRRIAYAHNEPYTRAGCAFSGITMSGTCRGSILEFDCP